MLTKKAAQLHEKEHKEFQDHIKTTNAAFQVLDSSVRGLTDSLEKVHIMITQLKKRFEILKTETEEELGCRFTRP